jgi:hypothetical protein
MGFIPVVGAIGKGGSTFHDYSIGETLTAFNEGAEARVFDRGDGSVIKVFPLNDAENDGAGFTFAVRNGKLAAQPSESQIDIFEKVLVLNAIGGVPTDILGLTENNELVVRQPKGWTGRMGLKERYRVNDCARLVWIPPEVVPLDGQMDSLYLANIEDGVSFIVGDLHEDNYLRNPRRQGRILDLIALRVTPALEADFPKLRAFIEENPVKTPGPVAFTTGAKVFKPPACLGARQRRHG